MSDVTIAAATLEGFRPPAGVTDLDLRIYCDIPFVPATEGDPRQPSVVGGPLWFQTFTCPVEEGEINIPEVTLPATIDATPGNARYAAAFYHPDTGALVTSFAGLQSFILPTATPTTWGAIFSANVTGVTFDPADGMLAPPAASGTNIAGADLDISGGKGTGNALPGTLAVRYPLIGASGSTVQSLSTERFPVSTSLYTNTTAGDAVTDGTNETSIFTGATASPGSTRTIEGGSCRVGTKFHIRVYGTFKTLGTPTVQFKVKLGSVIVAATGAAVSGNNSDGLFFIDCIIYVNAIGASGKARAVYEQRLTTTVANTVTPVFIVGAAGEPTVDFTANQTIDVTAQWGTAGGANNLQMLSCSIDRYR
jgi:hypothetical protein